MSTGQAVGGVVGAVAGFIVGGPTGALYGAQIGMAAGGYLDPPKGPVTEGPRLSDTSVQTSTYGAFIPRTYGTVAVSGNIFWLENNRLKAKVKKESSGGKGGGASTTTKTYTYSATVAVGLCEGTIQAIRRIWAGPNLIYDAGAGSLESVVASNNAARNFTFYYGDATQLADSRMQADLGAANVPAYRGLCYVVIKDFQLSKYGNAIPQFKFEVVNNGSRMPAILNSIATVPGPASNPYGHSWHITDDARAVIYKTDDNADPFAPHYRYEVGLSGDARGQLQGFEQPATALMLVNGWADQDLIYYWDDNYIYGAHPYGAVGAEWYLHGIGTQGNWGYYRKNGGDYLHIISSTLPDYLTDSGIIRRTGAVTELALDVPSSDPDGTIIAFCCGQSLFFTLHTGKILRCYDADLTAVLWSQDLSGEANLGANWGITVIRTDSDDVCYIKHGAYFWRANERGFESLGLVSGYTPSSSPDAYNQHVIGGIWYDYGPTLGQVSRIQLERFSSDVVALDDIISAECDLTGILSTSDIDVTDLSDSVTGYRVAKIGSIRNAIEPLQGVFPFDAIQSGYKIRFMSRGNAPVASAVIGDLGMDEQLRQTREMDSQLPVKITANYLDKGRNYDVNAQIWQRQSVGPVNERTMELPIVLTAAQAAQAVERLGYLYWLERVDFGPFSLPPTFSRLEPADVITLSAGYADYELRLTSVNYNSDGSIKCMARLNQASTYISQADADDVDQIGSVPFAGFSQYQVLDLPPINSDLQSGPGVVGIMAGYYTDWQGGTIFRSDDGSQTWTDMQSFASPCTYGYARTPLGASACTLIDMGSTLTVDLEAGTLESVSEAQMLNGANTCAYGINGRWEVLHFMTATLNGDGSYTLSGLWRGDVGSEWATGLHQEADLFVLLNDPDTAFIGLPESLIGSPRDYRGISFGDGIDTDISRSITYTAENLECLSPCHAAGTRSAGDLTITWQRRSRIGGWRDYVDAPLGETVEAYQVEILQSGNVIRTINAVTETAFYSATDQATDFGATQSSLDIRIYQLSSVVGRGRPLEATV